MKQRFLWIDFLRGLAVLGMIETHAVNSFLAPIYRSGDGFTFLSYINGLVAPTFLFIAGLLQGAWLRKNWNSPQPLAPKLRHLGLILLIGYGLQFPWDSLLFWQNGGSEKIFHSLGKIDVLHCIAITLAVTLLLSRLVKKIVIYDLLVALVSGVVIITAPFVWNSTLRFPTPILGYFSPRDGALFPLLPWSGFLLVGALASRWLQRPKVFAILFLLATAAGWLLRAALSEWFESQTYATRYDFFCFRLAVVFLSCALYAFLLTNQHPAPLTRALNWCGSRSLSLYVWHLVLLHSGLGILPPLRDLFPKTQPPHTVLWLYLLTLTGTVVLAVLWQRVHLLLKQTSFSKTTAPSRN